MPANPKIVILAGQDESGRILYHALSQTFSIEKVIVEAPYSRKKFLQYRLKKLGYVQVLGQILFQLCIVPYLRMRASGRIKALMRQAQFSIAPIPADKLIEVSSINALQTREILAGIEPDLIIVNATRIISSKVLQAFPVPFINTHAGITPLYRGVHGGYWALAQDDPANCGVTVHLVDAGVDTGELLYQKRILPTSKDNFVTYPILQQMEGITLLKQAIQDHITGQLKPHSHEGESRQWFHPTFWGYVWTWLRKGVK